MAAMRRSVSHAIEGLERLPAAELRATLASLLAAHPHLATDVERIVSALSAGLTSGTDPDKQIRDIAEALARELLSLDVFDLTTARENPWRHSSPSEDTWQRLHQAVVPTVEAMRHLIALARPTAALIVLQGVLLALYTLDDEPRGELLQGAPDFPAETAAWVWDVWTKLTRDRPPLPERFLRHHVPEWQWLRRAPRPRRRARQ